MISLKTQTLMAVLTVASMLAACQNPDSSAEQASESASADAETARLNAWLDERYVR